MTAHKIETQVVHAGTIREKPSYGITLPITQSATYPFHSSQNLHEFKSQELQGLPVERAEYDRLGNPTVTAVEKRLAALEGGEDALLFASGMAAITTLLLASLPTESHIIVMDNCYWHTRQFCESILKRLGIQTTFIPIGDYGALESAIIPKKTRLIVAETPTNPHLRIVDFEQLVAIAKKYKVRTVIDSTFGTPINQAPLAYGVDYVVHSATKYLGGHHDLMAGVVISSKSRIAALREAQTLMGAIIAPQNAFLLDRGLKTLALRVQKQNENGLRMAQFLETHSLVETVWYPALASHPDYHIAMKQMKGFGGVVSFTLKADTETTSKFIDALQIPYIATSLGGIESLIEQPALVLFYGKSEEEQQLLGLPGNLVRYAIGIEDVDDLINDLEQAFAQIG